jgi:hypothetical protein
MAPWAVAAVGQVHVAVGSLTVPDAAPSAGWGDPEWINGRRSPPKRKLTHNSGDEGECRAAPPRWHENFNLKSSPSPSERASGHGHWHGASAETPFVLDQSGNHRPRMGPQGESHRGARHRSTATLADSARGLAAPLPHRYRDSITPATTAPDAPSARLRTLDFRACPRRGGLVSKYTQHDPKLIPSASS